MNIKKLKFKDLIHVKQKGNQTSYKRSKLFDSLSQKDKDFLVKKFIKQKGDKNG